MRNLWRATAHLFWQHPILWLPVALADAIAVSLTYLQRLLQKHAADGLMQTHSVLGGRPEISASQTSILPVYLITVCLVAITSLLVSFLFANALLTIAAMLRNLAHAGRPNLEAAVGSIKPDLGRALFFALRLFTVSLVIGILASAIIMLPTLLLSARHRVANPLYALAESLVSAAVIAYLIAPHAINLLRPVGSAPAAGQEALFARSTAIATVILSTALSYLFNKAALPASPHAVQVTVHAIASEIATLPYAALFIALALLATTDSPPAGQQPETRL